MVARLAGTVTELAELANSVLEGFERLSRERPNHLYEGGDSILIERALELHICRRTNVVTIHALERNRAHRLQSDRLRRDHSCSVKDLGDLLDAVWRIFRSTKVNRHRRAVLPMTLRKVSGQLEVARKHSPVGICNP